MPEDEEPPRDIAADPEWLAEHSSDLMSRIAKIVGMTGLGHAGSAAGGIVYGKHSAEPVKGSEYGYVRHAEDGYAYTLTRVTVRGCLRCGWPSEELYEALRKDDEGAVSKVGEIGVCRKCEPDHWMFVSHMPRAVERRNHDQGRVVP